MLSTQVPGTKDKPYACEAPRTEGMFSSAIRIYGLVSPNILICFVPVIASEKFTSMDGLVSKLSAKLQQAAFNNSALLTLITFCDCKKDRELAFWRSEIVTSSRSEVGRRE